MALFRKLLIANRGEIAVRIIRAARELGIATVAVYSDVDRDALHVRFADEAYRLGPAPPAQSYLNVDRLLDVASRSGADAVHPGYGFFSENATFARAVIAQGLIWVGPHPAAIESMGDKLRARTAMAAAGIPIVPGDTTPLADAAAARDAAQRFGLPLALKASGGGGGKGLKIAHTVDEIEAAFGTAAREAAAYFGNGTIYAERYLIDPKHIELQILADKHGSVLHVGERDCSLQRRHQKLWEEAPPTIPETVRVALRDAGVRAARAIGYDSVGTIECLVSGGAFYFLEMNTRIQVEHTVSEMISGIDLVKEQLRVAAGEPLGYAQEDVVFRGHAIEVRVNAEDPARNFQPAPGTVTRYREPAGFGVRVDSAAFPGFTIVPDYDSMIAKLIGWDRDRTAALARLRRAIDEYEIVGVPTTLPLLRRLADFARVIDASYGTATLEPFALAAAAADHVGAKDAGDTQNANTSLPSGTDTIAVEVNGKRFDVRFLDLPALAAPGTARNGGAAAKPKGAPKRAAHGNAVTAPMHGSIVEVAVAAGDAVNEAQVLVVVEAMKMMNEIRAHKAGTVTAVHVKRGDTVDARAALVTIE